MNSPSENNVEAKQTEQKVLDAIRSGQAKVRPRWYFVLEAALMITGCVIAFVFVLYLASFIIFILRQTGISFAPSFGLAGWYSFFHSLPWILIILLIIFMLILALMVHRYAVVYERPPIYLFVGIVAVVVFGGLLVAATPFHRLLLNDSEGGGLPVLGIVYRGYGMQDDLDDIHRGVVIATSSEGFILENEHGETSTVVFGSTTPPFPPGVVIGSQVIIFGFRVSTNTIDGEGIETVTF
jgi:hypothetical protein